MKTARVRTVSYDSSPPIPGAEVFNSYDQVKEDVFHSYQQFRDEEFLTDVTLLVGPDQVPIKVHKLVLAARFEYFKSHVLIWA